MINKTQARKIAADWHGGQWSHLYGFQSSGKVTDKSGLLGEIQRELLDVIKNPQNYGAPKRCEAELRALRVWAENQ